ncbi:MAG TPA: CoA-transferase [Limnochordia bacterium]|nr:CoA-transferase [Limnochordia bacterium]
MSTHNYSIAELVIATMARLTEHEGLVTGVTPCSLAAALLSKSMYDRDQMVLWGAGSVLGPTGPQATLTSLAHDPPAVGRLTLGDVFDYVHQGRLSIWITPAQLDRTGNANISCIGPWTRPKTALVGSRGLPDDSVNLRGMCYYVPRHSARVFVERVDFVSALGGPRSAGDAAGRPAWVVSNLGVFDFGGAGGTLRLVSRHPGVETETVARQTGFALDIPPDVPTTPAPPLEMLNALRALDPEQLRDAEF